MSVPFERAALPASSSAAACTGSLRGRYTEVRGTLPPADSIARTQTLFLEPRSWRQGSAWMRVHQVARVIQASHPRVCRRACCNDGGQVPVSERRLLSTMACPAGSARPWQFHIGRGLGCEAPSGRRARTGRAAIAVSHAEDFWEGRPTVGYTT